MFEYFSLLNELITWKYYLLKIYYIYSIYFCNLLTFLGNFKEMCELFAKHVPSFNEIHERKINLTSWQIQEDIIDFVQI